MRDVRNGRVCSNNCTLLEIWISIRCFQISRLVISVYVTGSSIKPGTDVSGRTWMIVYLSLIECCVFQVSVKKTCAMFLTYNPQALPTFELPQDIKSNFRQVSLVRPDFGLVLKAKCSALGLKAPSVLSLRLRLVVELTKDQLWVIKWFRSRLLLAYCSNHYFEFTLCSFIDPWTLFILTRCIYLPWLW